MNKKRSRSLNWDEEEKQLFRSVLKKYAQIIENKRLDTNTNKIKTKAWLEVYKKFNELNSRHRELSQLRIQWKTMKVNARKTYSTKKFKSLPNKTGGGVRPKPPDVTIIEVKDLVNPAELLLDHNANDSDGIDQVKADDVTVKQENQQIADIKIETVTDVDMHDDNQGITPLVAAEDNRMEVTPMKNNMATTSAKKVLERKIMLNNQSDNYSQSTRTDHDEYVSQMISHSKMLKDQEHMRRMEMAEEDHLIKMAINKEKLKSAILEREILELKKAREERNS